MTSQRFRESTPVLIAQVLEKYLEKPIKWGVVPDVGRGVLSDVRCGVDVGVDVVPDVGRGVLPDVRPEPRSFFDEVCITSLDGSSAQVVVLEVMFPRVGISWEFRGKQYSGETEFYLNDRFLSIKCTNCSRAVTAVLLRKKIQCPWCAQVQSFSSPKKVIHALHEAHKIIEQYDPSWSGLEAKGRFEWLDGY